MRNRPEIRMAILLSMVVLFPIPNSAFETKPVVYAQVLGGQYFYNDTDNAFGGYASVSASPYMKFNDRWSLVPLYEGRYQGTKQVQDLIGGGTLFQDSQDHTFSMKTVRSFDNGFKWKAIGSYGWEWLRETKNEGWTKGLYDSRRASLGTEAEYAWDDQRFVRLAYDYYQIRFPNYQSLESQSQATGLGRELAQPNVLNNHNHAFTLSGQTALPANGLLEWSASETLRRFADQHVVVISGDLSGSLRHDELRAISAQATWPVAAAGEWRLLGGVGYRWSELVSNQNSYDAQKLVFRPAFYGYHSQTVDMHWTYLYGKENPWTLTWNTALGRQRYTDRLVQDVVGAYGADRTKVDTASTGLTFGYPISKGFQLTVTTAYGWSDSNNTDRSVYQYHYHTANYLAGFTYAF